jgi:hypothetical protein
MGIATTALVLALTGCGGRDSSNEGAAVPSNETPATSSPSPSESTATQEQYASLIARRSNIVHDLEEMSHCNWSGSGSLGTNGDLTCPLGVLSLQYEAMTVRLDLLNAQGQGLPKFDIGPPPAELQSLVDETVQSAQTLAKALKAVTPACAQTAAGLCGSKRVDASFAIDDMQHTLAAWGPYL